MSKNINTIVDEQKVWSVLNGRHNIYSTANSFFHYYWAMIHDFKSYGLVWAGEDDDVNGVSTVYFRVIKDIPCLAPAGVKVGYEIGIEFSKINEWWAMLRKAA